ncbi:hypothetical protein EBU94_05975, partial [bacterium]|nr:hypothetical protein [bacterium]
METIDKIVHERIWVTEYEDTCPIPDKKPETYDPLDPSNYTFLLYKQTEWAFKRRYLDVNAELKDFGNPLCRIEILRHTLCLEEDENKVSLKLFLTNKSRKPGVVWFSRKSSVFFVTFNKNTKNFYSGYISGYNKRNKNRRLNCNHFYNQLNEIYRQLIPLTTTVENPEYPEAPIIDINKVNEIYGKFYSIIGISPRESYYDLSTDFYFKYLIDRGIKIPDNFLAYKQCGSKPPQRLFKKNGMKLVETYMQHYGLKGDKFRKILHTTNKIDFYELQGLVKLFSIDFLIQRPESEIRTFIQNTGGVYIGSIAKNTSQFYGALSKKEKLNFYLTVLAHFESGLGLHSINDHARFYTEISKHEKVRWNAKDIKSFREEHVDFTEKYDFYTHGHYDREYDSNFVEHIEKPFIVDGVIYTPIVLEKNNQYIEESSHQSNCVKTYNSNVSSVIVSLRNEKGERLTMQFTPKKLESKKVIWKNAQTRARFNENPKEEWKEAIEIIENKMSVVTDFSLPKMWFINYNSRIPVELV